MNELFQGDCMQVLLDVPEGFFDAVVTDPPYELGFMAKRWDSSGIAHQTKLWAEVLRVLKPGAHLLAFGGTRTYHHMVWAIECAGFEIRDSIHWLYGSGFPKSLNLPGGLGTALKPAHEPIVLARKPLAHAATVAENVQNYGTGVLNIDASRIPGKWTTWRKQDGSINHEQHAATSYAFEGERQEHPEGRWPANVIVDEDVAGLLGDKAPFFFCAKASRSEREAGCTHLPSKSGAEAVDRKEESAGLKNPRAGAGRTASKVHNHHPTVKPISLMRYLCKLVTPSGGTILDPFMGSGTTGIAALLEGFDFVGIEQESEYLTIAQARLEHWQLG
jgi:site-specific DNA-methyltransferase (adenine-specific)